MPDALSPTSPTPRVLTLEAWSARARAHRERVQRWTVPFRRRRSRGETHPVHDFLFRYYSYSPGKLESWHPSPGVLLADSPEARRRFQPPRYVAAGGHILRDSAALGRGTVTRLQRALDLMRATEGRPPNLGCHGMHEWAMVYRGEDVRHEGTAPLRLRQDEIDALVESRPVVCSHYDAFRFFTSSARPLNRVQPSAHRRAELEQPGCVHANMDLYGWAGEAMPWVGSALLLRAFELAVELRELDMRASPYDLRAFGYEPIPVETEEGRAAYRRRQGELADRARRVRAELIATLDPLLMRRREAPAGGAV